MQGSDAVWGWMLAGLGDSRHTGGGPGTRGVNGKVHGTDGVDLGEAEPNEAEEVSGGRAELWALREVGDCG